MSDDGSDDPSPRPVRKIKRVVLMPSSESSDSDESIGPTETRRKRMRVVSDLDTEGSSDSSVPLTRRSTLPPLRDSDDDSDTSGWATDHSDAPKSASKSTSASNTPSAPKPASVPSKTTSGFASDSSEGNSDKCSICLMRFTTQLVGTPQNCEHIFCFDCITEWSKNVNTCPVDRITFENIVVRTCAGGRVLRTEPVKVVERRPSVEMLVVEDPTVCEICGSADNEETMLLCDGCDLGFHMQCLTPPLREIPAEQWLCPNCDNILDVIHLSEVEDLFTGLVDIDLPTAPRSVPLRQPRNVRRSSRNQNSLDEPSTSSGRRGGGNADAIPSTSRGSRNGQRTSSRATTTNRRAAGTQRRKYKRRRTKTVIIEYEVQENGKFPITKRVKRRVKKRKIKKRQPRTAARRSHVRASVRAKLAHMAEAAGGAGVAPRGATAARGAPLAARRLAAGIPALSLFGSRHQLEYFSEEDEHDVSEGAMAAVAVRPTPSILSAYRQARRKMVTIPSPPHASSAPDLLSSILDSQSKLHSKNSIVSISVDGNVNIKLQTRKEDKSLSKTVEPKKDENKKEDKKIDLTQGEDAAKKAPSYPGQSRGGGWGGGYRGNYHREQGSGNFNRGGNYAGDGNSYAGGGGYGDNGAAGGGGYGYQNRQQGNSFNSNMRRDDADGYGNYPRRQYPYPQNDDNNFDRNRRPQDTNRPQNFPHNQRPNDQGRHSLGPSWQPYGGAAPAGPRRDGPQMRHSIGGSENPLDMRMGQVPPQNSHAGHPSDAYHAEPPKPQPYRPLPEPPVFKFDKTPEVEKSEDERSDSGLVIDTEKYDPTEPTNDDDSGDEGGAAAEAAGADAPAAPSAPAAPGAAVVQHILAGMDAGALHVPATVLDSAVRQVLQEHRDLISPAVAAPRAPRDSDDDSDGDCPNFSIYSATSVHIANDSGAVADAPAERPGDDMADLVQEDDDSPPRAEPDPPRPAPARPSGHEAGVKKKTEEELKEKVSKRCPITTNPRNPIKIKLNTPSLIKRHVPLYDEEEPADDAEAETKPDSTEESPKQNLNKGSTENLSSSAEPLIQKIETVALAQSDDIEETKKNEEKVEAVDEKEATEAVLPEKENEAPRDKTPSLDEDEDDNGDCEKTPKIIDEDANEEEEEKEDPETGEKESEKRDDSSVSDKDEKLDELATDEDVSDGELPARRGSDARGDGIEKMTESISETEDERSYTPCLDENKSKDTSLETDKDKGIEGLDTEMISEDDGNEIFSEEERQAERSPPRPAPPPPAEEGEILDKRKDKPERDEPKKKKRKDKDAKREAKKDSKEKKKKRGEVAFKKLSKSGKERNYRDKDKEDRPRRDSSDGERKRKRKEKRKDLERYDVRTVVSEKRRRAKDPFGRDVSPHRSRSASLERSPPPERSPSPARRRRSSSRPRRSSSRPRRSASRPRRSASRARRTPSPRPTPRRASPSPRGRASPEPRSPSPRASPARRRRRSGSRARRRRSTERARKRRRSPERSPSPRDKAKGKRRRRARSERPSERRVEPRRRSPKRRRPRRRSAGRSPVQPPPGPGGAWSPLSVDSRLLSPRTPPPEPSPPPQSPRTPRRRREHPPRHRRAPPPGPSKEVFTSGDNILVSVSFKEQERARGSPERRERRERRRERRRRRRAEAAADAARPVAIIDLERSPFRELTPSPRNVIVLSDSEHAEPPAPDKPPDKQPPPPTHAAHATHATHATHAATHATHATHAAPHVAHAAPAPEPTHHAPAAATNGPRTPPSRSPGAAAPAPAAAAPAAAAEAADARGPNTPPEPPSSPDAYDPFEPTRSASASPRAASPPRPSITLETAQKTNLSADDVIDRRPLSPMEKVMALLASTRDVSPEPPPSDPTPAPAAASPPLAPAPPAHAHAAHAHAHAAHAPPRIVLPDAPAKHPPKGANAPKLFLAKPSPIKSDPIKPMQLRPPAAAGGGGDSPYSPYSPGESDFGDLFEPPAPAARHKPRDIFDALIDKRRGKSAAAKVPVKLNKKKGKTQVGVKIDEDNLKILDDLPSSAVEMQVKSKFLKKLNRQERVVEEVKLVLKPHYNKKHVTKDEYKDILRRAVPKICHNKSGEINPSKIQALVEAYVKKFRKKHKLGLA